MSVAGNQAQTFLRLAAALRPRWRTDHGLPRTIQSLLTGDRSFGSRDRRLYRELLYTTLRYLPWIEPWLDRDPAEAVHRTAWLAAETPATARFRAELAAGPAPEGDRSALLPAWFREHAPELFADPELDAQLQRAPLWLRLQTGASGRAAVADEFAARGWTLRPSDLLRDATEVVGEADVTKTESWDRGLFEVQDLGSQLILESHGLPPGGLWLDACAGAGGKTLQLARILGPTGAVEAHDIRPAALEELVVRAQRARLRRVSIVAQPPDARYDGVLVDAPCSGSGTWRRSPHLKWNTTPEIVAERAALQGRVLRRFARCVRPGGLLVYATCSLSPRENEDIVAGFLAETGESFRPEPPARTFGFPLRRHGLTIWPARHRTDGFYVCALRRR
jgi:16S rRNA (cytosine967-C5)-methyltransferase